MLETPDEQRPDTEPGISVDMPIWEYVAQLMCDVPKDVQDALPTDGAFQHDHYRYRFAKRPRSAGYSPMPSTGSPC